MIRAHRVRSGLSDLSEDNMTAMHSPIPTTIISSEEDDYGSHRSHGSGSDTRVEHENETELQENLRILQRQQGIEQLIDSEQKYCTALGKLITEYMEPLSKYLSSQHSYTLFGDIKTIYEKNISFSIALEQKYKTFDPSSSLIGDEIIKFWNADLRILYQNYVNRHEEVSKLLISLQTDSKVMYEYIIFCVFA